MASSRPSWRSDRRLLRTMLQSCCVDFLDIEQVFDYCIARSVNTILVIHGAESVTGARYVTGTSTKETT